jgi:outer membrane protein insertion porin family
VFDRRLSLCAIVVAAAFAVPTVARAQIALPEDPARAGLPEGVAELEGRPIVEVRLIGSVPVPEQEPKPLNEQAERFAENQIRSRAGDPFSAAVVLADLRTLNRTGRYSLAEPYVDVLSGGGVRLTFVLIEQPIVEAVDIVGNKRIGTAELREVADVLVGTPVDRVALDRSARAIEGVYREDNYYRVEVTVDETELAETGVVIFRVQEGARLKITDIRFEGNESFTPGQLRTAVGSKEAWLLDSGRIDENQLIADVASIREFYGERGYLNARVGHAVRESPNAREAIVTFVIDEGPLYTLRDIVIEYTDATPDRPGLLGRDQVLGLIDIQPGDAFGLRDVRSAVDRVRRALGQLGYVDVRVDSNRLFVEGEPVADLLLRITQGGRYLTGEVVVRGNELTRDKVVRRRIDVRPNRPLDLGAIERGEQRLRALNLFDRTDIPRITVQDRENPLDPPDSRRRDVLVEVEETNTGSINFGGIVTSDAGLIGNFSVTQRNFDIADVPDSFAEFVSGRAFRGAGQTLDFRLQPGVEVQTYSVSLTEPYLFESAYSGTWLARYRTRDFTEYDEERLSGRFGIGRRFGTRWVGNVATRVESIQLSDFASDAPADFFSSADRELLTGLGFTLSRSTLDSRVRPTRGTRVQIGAEQVGALGGDRDFTRLNLDGVAYLTLYEDFRGRNTILKVDTRVGYIPQDASAVPVYERSYLGGRNFRGFDFRTVSPRGFDRNGNAADEPIGGTWLFFAGLEVQQPIVGDFLSIVAFVDSGTVTSRPGFEDYRVSVGTGFRIFVPQLSPAPLAFDFGFPIVKEPTDERRLFSFSVDLPF